MMNIKYKKDGSIWEELYPKTLGDNVEMSNGKTVQEVIDSIIEKFPDTIPLWEGKVFPSSSEYIYPSKKLSECSRGWTLRFQRNSDLTQQVQYEDIPKIHLPLSEGGVRLQLGTVGGDTISKYIYVLDDKIFGHDANSSGGNEDLVLTGVFEY